MYRTSPASASGSMSHDVESTIRGLTQDFCTGFNTGNYDQVAALFAPDALLMAPNREAAQGPKAIERVLRELGDSGYQDLRFTTTRVDYSGDMAFEAGRYTVNIQLKDKNLVDGGNFIRVWRRLGAWLIVADSRNSNLPNGGEGIRFGAGKVA